MEAAGEQFVVTVCLSGKRFGRAKMSRKVWLCGLLASGCRWRYSCAWMVVRSFHGSRQEHRSGCDTTPAGACCFLWRGPSNSGAEGLDRESESPELGCLRVCVGWIRVVSIRSCVVDSRVSSYMLVIPDGLHYIYVGWKPMRLFMVVHTFNYNN